MYCNDIIYIMTSLCTKIAGRLVPNPYVEWNTLPKEERFGLLTKWWKTGNRKILSKEHDVVLEKYVDDWIRSNYTDYSDNDTERRLYKSICDEELDELEVCIKREIMSILKKRLQITIDSFNMDYKQFKQSKRGIKRKAAWKQEIMLPLWVDKCNPFSEGEFVLYSYCVYFFAS